MNHQYDEMGSFCYHLQTHLAAAHLFVKPVTYTVSKFFVSTRPAGCSAGRPGGRPGGARVVSGAEKKII